jgi:hypothetical protein
MGFRFVDVTVRESKHAYLRFVSAKVRFSNGQLLYLRDVVGVGCEYPNAATQLLAFRYALESRLRGGG